MYKKVDLFRKKEYIRWFLNTYKLKKPEMEKVLQTLLQNPELLEKVQFIEDIRNLSDAVLISTNDAQTISFILRLNNIYYYDVDEFLEQLNNYPPPELYVWLSFNRDYICSMCTEILSGPPKTYRQAMNQRVIQDLEQELHKKLYSKEVRRKELLMLIDRAIENNDTEMFVKLSEEYKKLVS